MPSEESHLPPPFVDISGIPNFRDLGGWAISSSPSQSIRKGLIYRSADPGNVSRTGIFSLKSLGVKKIYDLRSKNEIARNVAAGRGGVVKWTWGCDRVFVPVFTEEDYSPEAIAKRFADYCDKEDEVCLSFVWFFGEWVRRRKRKMELLRYADKKGVRESIYSNNGARAQEL